MTKNTHEVDQYQYIIIQETQKKLRAALFERMQNEGLLASALHSYHTPCLSDWLKLTKAEKGWLLCCSDKKNPPHKLGIQDIKAMAFISPIKGRLWSFDFTVFREHFSEAIPMSKGALRWIFSQEQCRCLLGICAISNRHAWRLAQAAGFHILGKAQDACFIAKKQRYEDGVLVMASSRSLSITN